MSSQTVPAIVENNLDAIHATKDGKIILSSSSLTGRYWRGSLWCFPTVEDSPDVLKCITGIEAGSGISDLVSLGDNKFALGLDSGSVEIYKLEEKTFEFVGYYAEHDDYITNISLSADKSTLLSAGADSCIKVWDTENWIATTFRPVHDGAVWCVCSLLDDPKRFISGGQDGKTVLFDLNMEKPASVIDSSPSNEITAIAWRPNSTHQFISGDDEGIITLKDLRNAGSIYSFPAQKKRIHRLLFSECQPQWLATCADDTTVCVIDIKENNGDMLYTNEEHEHFVRGLAWSSDNDLITCGWDKRVLKHVLN